MRIALTHNLRLSDSEEEAEFDTRETVDALAGAIDRLGHRVERIEVSGPASRTVARLEAYGPDLIFNTAEGRRGRFREAFFPALFDELGMPYTGSDAYALSLTLDKQLTKLVLAQHGVPTPRWQYVQDPRQLQLNALRYPVIVKPNFEGSSKGITQDSVVEDALRVHEVVAAALARYPAGVLVEEFIAGRDVTVPYLEAAAPERRGVLQPVEYLIAEQASAGRRHAIYDYELKTRLDALVSVRAPAELKRAHAERVLELSEVVYRVLEIRDLGRIDFRISDDGQVYFLEINALPSLEKGAGIYAAAALEGLHADAVVNAVLRSAIARWGISDQRTRRGRPRRTERLKVGFTFNVKRVRRRISRASRTRRRSTTRPRPCRRSARRSPATGTRWWTSRRPRTSRSSSPRRRWTWSSTSPKASRGGAASPRCPRSSSCSTSPTPAPTPPRSPSRSTRRSPSGWSGRTASSRPTTWS